MIILSTYTLLLVLFMEKRNSIKRLRIILVVVCVIFFLSNRILLIYVWLEVGIFLLLIIVLGYGSQVEKVSASYYLIFYSIVSRIPLLWLLIEGSCFNTVFFFNYNESIQYRCLLILRAPFLIKFPIMFLHLWLPKIHVEASTTARILLAGLVLKIGTYGITWVIKLYPMVQLRLLYRVSMLGIVIVSITCIFIRDIKLLVAYRSVVHMNFLFLLLIFNTSISRIIVYLLIYSHGLISIVLFYLVGELYSVLKVRLIYLIRGIQGSSLMFSLVILLRFLANSGAPFFLTFYREVIGLRTLYSICPWISLLLLVYFLGRFYYSVRVAITLITGTSLKCYSYNSLYVVVPVVVLLNTSVLFF